MTPQTPAEGILLHKDWGHSRMYHVTCECTCDECTHTVEVEADDVVTVTTYTTQKTNFWSEAVNVRYDIDNSLLQAVHWRIVGLINGLATRLRLTWTLWTKGYVEYQASILMSEQQALNYAETLKSAVNDVKVFRDQRRQEKSK